MDNINNVVYLYKDAKVIYGAMTLTADTVMIFLDKNELHAKSGIDSVGRVKKVKFEDGDQNFEAPEMTYNFKTKKGKIIKVITGEQQSYVLADVAKRMPNDDIFIAKGKITTCEHEDPHFYFLSERLKVKPGKFIVAGPTHLVIRGIHTPILLPFAFFPNNKKRKSGILIPGPARERGYSGFRELGYHWAINDYMTADVLTDFFFDGSFRSNSVLNYKKLYKYDGNLSFRYNQIQQGTRGLSDDFLARDFAIGWRYNQDAKSHPKSRFTANIDAKSPTFNQTQVLNNFTAFNTVQAYNRSSIGWSWNDKWGGIQTTADLNQNFGRKEISMRAPNLTVRLNQKPIGLGFQTRTTFEMRNEVTTGDSTFFSAQTLQKMNSGMKGNTVIEYGKSVRIPFGFLRYINLTVPNININAYGNFSTTRQSLDENNKVLRDTVRAYRTSYDMSLGNMRLNTKIFGTFKFKDGMYVKGIRHVIDPSVSLSYNPYFLFSSQDINRDLKDVNGNIIRQYSIYDHSMYRPVARENLSLSYSLNNVLEGKFKQKNDTAYSYKKVNIIQALNATGGYNFLADSLKWSDVNLNLNANPGFLKTLNVNARINPYEMDSTGRSINQLMYTNSGTLGRLTFLNASTNIGLERKNFLPKQSRDIIMKDGFNWTMNIGYTFTYNKPGHTATLTNAVTNGGSVNFSKSFSMAYTLAIDIKNIDIGRATNVNIKKDLHCWEINLIWFPFENNINYMFSIRPKAGLLRDLEYKRNSNQQRIR